MSSSNIIQGEIFSKEDAYAVFVENKDSSVLELIYNECNALISIKILEYDSAYIKKTLIKMDSQANYSF